MTADTAPAWDGVPLNPERDGWHWLQWGNHDKEVLYWDVGMWWDIEGRYREPADFSHCTYVAPCHTPAEVSAQIEAARREEREACAELVRLWPVDSLAEAYSIYMLSERDDDMAAAIRARSTEGTP